MGNSLHNKIYLGRRSWHASLLGQTVLALGVALGIGVAWAKLRIGR